MARESSPYTNMLYEARHIVDAARRRGIVLRLLGGLGVAVHCRDSRFCARDHADIDMAGLGEQQDEIRGLLEELGYSENANMRMATENRQLQFSRPCAHGSSDAPAHQDDHVDVFLNTFRMDHEIDLRTRLDVDCYTIPVSDLLLTKLQVFRLTDKDVQDIFTLLKDAEATTDERRGAINVSYLARLCSSDWGLFYDVCLNLQKCGALVQRFGMAPSDEAQVMTNLTRVIGAIDAVPKSLRWKIRAKAGTRLQWRNAVEER